MVPLFFFLLSLQRIWFRSSMDRMKDSGSFHWVYFESEGMISFFITFQFFTKYKKMHQNLEYVVQNFESYNKKQTLNKCFSFI